MLNRSQPKASYQKAKARANARSAAITLAGQDIAPLPKVKDARRRDAWRLRQRDRDLDDQDD